MSGFEMPRIGAGPLLRPPSSPSGRDPFGDDTRVDDGEAASFGGTLESAIAKVDSLGKEVGNEVQALASGEPVALHDMMMSMGKSEVAFNLMLEVRNKLVDAWEKLSRSVV